MRNEFDWKNPDYRPIFQERADRLRYIQENPGCIPGLRAYYAENIADCINDWGMTYDPRFADLRQPTIVPFLLFPKQREWVEWLLERWRSREPGTSPKSRDIGLSWLAIATASTIAMLHEGVNIGFGSRKEEYVDSLKDPKSLFWKARKYVTLLPPFLNGYWDERRDSVHKRIIFPITGSTLTGEAGNNIGRGDRASIYIVDESAYLERPQLIDASLSATTNCRIDISSANGTDNSFYQRVTNPRIKSLPIHWRDDPRKDDAWYAKQCDELPAVVVAQEIDINFTASKTGILIPSAWVQAAVDADVKLGMDMSGQRRGALDVADEGIDLNAFAEANGVIIEAATAWSGKGDDIFGTVLEAFRLADEAGIAEWRYDADGMGAGVRGDARVINEQRPGRTQSVSAWRASGAVEDPTKPIPSATPRGSNSGADIKARLNGDFFLNANAQAWWELRVRFQRVARALVLRAEGQPIPWAPDELICLRSGAPGLAPLMLELSQPTYSQTTAGKILVDKAPEGARSPNHADAVKIVLAPRKKGFTFLA